MKIKTMADRAAMPTCEAGVYRLFPLLGTNTAVHPGKTVDVPTGISLNIPTGEITFVTLSDEVIQPNTGLCLAEGIKLLTGTVDEIVLKVFNPTTTVQVILNQDPIGYLVAVPIALSKKKPAKKASSKQATKEEENAKDS